MWNWETNRKLRRWTEWRHSSTGHSVFLWSASGCLSAVWVLSEKTACQITRKPNQSTKISNLILQSASLCLYILLEGKKESWTAGWLFYADTGAVRSAGIKPGSGKDRAVSGTVDSAFCYQQSVRFGRRTIWLDWASISICSGKMMLYISSLSNW